MFKLIFFLVGLAVAVIFSLFNLGNTSSISLGFKVVEDFPVVLNIMISFLAGAVFTLPFAFSVSIGNKKTKKKNAKAEFIAENMQDEIVPQNVNETEL